MSLFVKICGLDAPDSVAMAVVEGAAMVGFVFYPPSPRNLTPEAAGRLVAGVPSGIDRVGLFVDPKDSELGAVLAEAPLDLIQLHGSETPARVKEVRATFKRPVIKAIKVENAADLDAASAFDGVADWLLFDAKPPKTMTNALPGGNRVSFDWTLLQGRRFKRPWLLAGGLDADNLAEAVRQSGAMAVDVSSGVEQRLGVKDPKRIQAFLRAARAL
ncbi:phosphoribosylanthranilate isomerase [Desertibaculum subflavum]|uniref:phosphoribosylanthranilate isomerase n=1 Tax=Desertibaculum subflavum TaxID=2268458 RepID=UPI000E67320B